MKWFRKKKEPEEQAQPDVILPHVMPNHDHIVELGYDAKQYIEGFLADLTRTQLMDFQDAKQFDGTKAEDAAWEAASEREWEIEWPMGRHTYKERIPDIVRASLPLNYTRKKDKKDNPINLDLNNLVNQVEGIQKKLDRLIKLVENTEVTMSGKTAINL